VPASPDARAIADLFVLLLAIAGLLFAVVLGLLLYMTWRFRERAGAPEPRQVVGQPVLEVGWTVTPAILLVGVFLLSLPTLRGAVGPPADALAVEMTGHQFWWEYRYTAERIVTANELHIPVDQPVQLRLQSADVIHSYWIPQLNGKTDVIPGRTNTLTLYAETPGTYLGQCAEFCGIQHAWMLLRVIAMPRSAFDAWVAVQQQPAAAPATVAARQGQQVFLNHTCIDCHTIGGTPAQSPIGPDLTHFGSRETLAAGVLANTPANLRRWLRDPQTVKPGSLMPRIPLSEDEIDALATYLEGLR
jgi:cytochrome c oxidase subunit 2